MLCSLSYARTLKEIIAEFKLVKGSQVKAFLDNVTTDEWRQIADFEISSDKTIHPSAFIHMISSDLKNLKPLLNEYDVKFAATSKYKLCVNLANSFRRMPKCASRYVDEIIGKKRPGTADVFKSVMGSIKSASLLQNITLFAETYADVEGVAWYCGSFEQFSSRILTSAPKVLKKLIREKGGSFIVGADGVNPVQSAIDSLSAALNRPRMQGLKEWVAEWYPNHAWIEPPWMSEESLNKLMDDVFYGQVDFCQKVQYVLRANLGVEGYNEFIKKYNQ